MPQSTAALQKQNHIYQYSFITQHPFKSRPSASLRNIKLNNGCSVPLYKNNLFNQFPILG